MDQESRDKSSLKLMRIARLIGIVGFTFGLGQMFIEEDKAIAFLIILSLEIGIAQWFITTWTKEMKDV